MQPSYGCKTNGIWETETKEDNKHQRKPKEQIKYGQSRETGNTQYTRQRMKKKKKNKHNIENYKDKYRGPMLGRHKH